MVINSCNCNFVSTDKPRLAEMRQKKYRELNQIIN